MSKDNDTPTLEQKRAAARTAAAKALREKYPDDWNSFLANAMQEQGVEWEPRLTAEQKAQQQIEELYAKFPHLRPAVPAES